MFKWCNKRSHFLSARVVILKHENDWASFGLSKWLENFLFLLDNDFNENGENDDNDDGDGKDEVDRKRWKEKCKYVKRWGWKGKGQRVTCLKASRELDF